MERKKHTIHIRDLDHDVYVVMWNLRKKLKARSWADMMKKICASYAEDVEEFEWI